MGNKPMADLRSSSVNETRSTLLIPKLDLSKVKGQFDKKNAHQTLQPVEGAKPFVTKKDAMMSLE